MDALERRCQIIEILCLKKHITMRELAERFHVSTRTIRSDVELLSLTYPVQTTRGRYNGGVSIMEGYRPQNAHLTQPQREFLYRIMPQLTKADQEIARSILHDFALTQ